MWGFKITLHPIKVQCKKTDDCNPLSESEPTCVATRKVTHILSCDFYTCFFYLGFYTVCLFKTN